MPGKDTLEAEIREIVDLGKGIGSTKVIFEHVIGLRVPADIYYPIRSNTIRGKWQGTVLGGKPFWPHVLLAVCLLCYLLLSAALLQLVHLAIALSLWAPFTRSKGAWISTFS